MSYENSIAFLGPAGTYCNEAALRFAARLGIDDPDLVECASFDEVFDCVDDGTVRFGVVGKENSLEGPVTATLDNFAFRTDSVILAEEVIDVRHCLAMHPEAARSDIRRIASHPQASRSAAAFWRSILRAFQRFPWPQRPKARGWRPAILPRRVSATPLPLGCTARAWSRSRYRTTPRTRPLSHWWVAWSMPSFCGGSRYKTSLALFCARTSPVPYR